MPRRDGTGPMLGRGLGLCTGVNAVRYDAGLGMGFRSGLGLACRRGFSGSFAVNQTSSKTEKELLQEQKDMLQNRLEVINRQLENL
ncbi:MAG: DUF5320 domain-containing protein [Thermotaleaceae bacterium]